MISLISVTSKLSNAQVEGLEKAYRPENTCKRVTIERFHQMMCFFG